MGGSFKQNKVGWRGLFKRPCWTFLRDKVLSNSDCLTLLWIDKRLKPEKIRNVNMNGKLSDPIVCRWGPWRQWKQQHHQSPGNKNMSHRRKKEEMVLYPFWFTKKVARYTLDTNLLKLSHQIAWKTFEGCFQIRSRGKGHLSPFQEGNFGWDW